MSRLLSARAPGRRGAALVEFTLVCGLVLLLLFGIIEVGLLFRDQATLAQAAREAARSAALGSPTTVAGPRAVKAASGLALTTANVTLEKSADNGTTWTALGDTSATPPTNDAAPRDLVRATVTYAHPWVTSLVFSSREKSLSARMVMQRE